MADEKVSVRFVGGKCEMKSKQGASPEETQTIKHDEGYEASPRAHILPKRLFFADYIEPVFDGPRRPEVPRQNDEE